MRGGPVRGSMKLDNRPKKLLVKGVHEDGSQALRDWYEVRKLFSFVHIFGLGSLNLNIFLRRLATWNPLNPLNLKTVHTLSLSSHGRQRNRLVIPPLIALHRSPIIKFTYFSNRV
jgi:RNA-binding protein 26